MGYIKAAGYDGVPAELFKACPAKLSTVLDKLFAQLERRESPGQVAARDHYKIPKERKFEVD